MIYRDPHHTLDAAAVKLALSPDDLRAVICGNDSKVSLDLTLDVVAALVYEWGIDPKWLLTGQYDGGVHRQALMLGENRTRAGRQEVRDLIQLQYSRLRERRFYLSLPPTLEALREKVASLLNPR